MKSLMLDSSMPKSLNHILISQLKEAVTAGQSHAHLDFLIILLIKKDLIRK